MVIVVVDVGVIILSIVIIVIVRILVADKRWGNPNSSSCTQTNSSTALDKYIMCLVIWDTTHNTLLVTFHLSLHKD